MFETNKIIQGDALEVLGGFPDGCVDCCVTSPPYWNLRDYNVEGQIGLEISPEVYVRRLVEVFREVRRCLKPDGTLWLNLGDSYANDRKSGGKSGNKNYTSDLGGYPRRKVATGLKAKDLIGIPWRVAFALQADGWWLRSDIIWAKANPMPESVTDRPTKAHEYVFLLAKSAKYYYDHEAVKEPQVTSLGDKSAHRFGKIGGKVDTTPGKVRKESGEKWDNDGAGRNRRSVWEVTTKPYPEAHFATYPEELIEPCIKAGSSERGVCPACGKPWVRIVEKTNIVQASANGSRFDKGKTGITQGDKVQKGERYMSVPAGWHPSCSCNLEPIPAVVLDPFMGSGTTGAVALRLKRNFVGVELNPEYIKLANKRIYHGCSTLDKYAGEA